MFSTRAVRIGRLFGIPLEVNPTWFIIFGIVASALSFSYFPTQFPGRPMWVDITSGVVTALVFFGSIVFHELSHSLVARAGGIHIERVTLFIFGGVAQMEEEPKTAGREFVMALAGPGASLFLAAMFYLGFVITQSAGVADWIWGPLEYLAMINLFVAVFNLLPGFPLDGGRVLRSILWGFTGDLLKATRWAARAGQLIGWTFMVAAVFGVLQGSLNLIWLGLIGWFISSLAESAYQQQVVKARLREVRVADIMTPSPMVAPGEMRLDDFVHEYLLGGRHSRYPITLDGTVVGLVSLAIVKGVPRDQWGSVAAADVAERDIISLTVDPDEPAEDIVQRVATERPGALLVVRDGHLVGIVTRADVLSRLRRADI